MVGPSYETDTGFDWETENAACDGIGAGCGVKMGACEELGADGAAGSILTRAMPGTAETGEAAA